MKRFNDTYLIFFRHYVYENMYIGLILSSNRFDIIMWCLISFHGMSKLLYRNKLLCEFLEKSKYLGDRMIKSSKRFHCALLEYFVRIHRRKKVEEKLLAQNINIIYMNISLQMFGTDLPFPAESPDHLWFYYINNNRTFMLDGQGVTAEVVEPDIGNFFF